MTDIEVLLQQVANVLDMRNKVPKIAGAEFNIFTILNLEKKEVDTHCRLIYELLRPDGQHDLGRAFLEEFFRLVLRKPFPDFVSVKREYVINALEDDVYGRIDFFLEGRDCCYPIEVKIKATDQNRQIERYTAFAKKAKENQVYYLTLDGHEPSEDGIGNLKQTDVECLSFSSDIRDWLVRCGEIAWKTPAVLEIIRQYICLIDKLTGSVQEDEYMEMIKNMINISKESYQSAVAVEQAIKPVRTEMMRRVFGEIENHIGDRLKIFEPQRNYINLSKAFYESRKRVWPGLSYLIGTCGDYKIALRFEIEDNLYYGVVFFKNEWDKVPEKSSEIIDAFPNDSWKDLVKSYKSGSWWLWWEYLPSNNIKIDFRKMDGCYPDLYDLTKHKEIMKEIFTEIDTHLDSIKKNGVKC